MYTKYTHLFTFNLAVTKKKPVGDGEKLLICLNSALQVLLGTDIFPRVPKKKLHFVAQCNLSARTTDVSSARGLQHTADVQIKTLGIGRTKEGMEDLSFPRLCL
jgi:hypothetical protein